ncbi:hypothetical protein [Streptomyces sp. NBC_00057]|uniref:hypothetical protein n=1 Tax=Streptomyces sp. NBC_00057 TaxID=2975634 RepID=UPI00324FAC3F
MTDRSPDPKQRAAARREELLARLREHNKRSLARADTTRRVAQSLKVTADGIQCGDVLAAGGVPHRVVDVRELQGRRKRLEFENGNVYVLQPWVSITVVRERGGDGALCGRR